MIAVLHDYFLNPDGGGRLALTLAREFQADLVHGFRSPDHPFFDPPQVREISLGVKPWPQGLRQIALARAFSNTDLNRYDRVVYSGAYAPLAVLGRKKRGNILYCHTPPRFLFDQSGLFLSRTSPPLRPLFRKTTARLRELYTEAARRMDLILANSNTVRERIRTHLGLDSEIVHPPCGLDRFNWLGQKGYYLSLARLDPLKRVDLAVRAFCSMPDKKLVLVSDGPEKRRLRRLARGAKNIVFAGRVDEERLAVLVGECAAAIFVAKEEDFGLSPVEAMAAGKPVIAAGSGGPAETVVHGRTGLLLSPNPSPEEIARAVTRLDPETALSMRRDCRARAELFSRERFVRTMRKFIE